MFIPNVPCTITRTLATDIYGRPVFGTPTPARCGIVRLEEASQTTSVRTDSSASRGSAKEEVIKSRLLLPAHFKIAIGDKVTLQQRTLVVQSVFPRHNVMGVLDHWQLDLQILVEE